MANELRLADGRSVTVARLRDGDQAGLQAFHAGLSPRSAAFFLPHRYDDATLARVAARNAREDDIVYVARAGDRIVAYFFLWYARRRVPLLGIGITDEYQDAGLGHQLMHILIETARRLGCEGIELTTALDNDRAFALYRRCGFRYLRDVENVVGDGSIKIERCMFLPLAEDAAPMTEPHAPPV